MMHESEENPAPTPIGYMADSVLLVGIVGHSLILKCVV